MISSSSRIYARTCLLVEDDPIERRVLERLLRRSGRQMLLLSVGTLEAARNILNQGEVVLLLLDNTLPDGTGADFALELRNQSRFKTMQFAIVSEWPTPFMYAKAEKAGALSVLRKRDLTAEIIGDIWDRARTAHLDHTSAKSYPEKLATPTVSQKRSSRVAAKFSSKP